MAPGASDAYTRTGNWIGLSVPLGLQPPRLVGEWCSDPVGPLSFAACADQSKDIDNRINRGRDRGASEM